MEGTELDYRAITVAAAADSGIGEEMSIAIEPPTAERNWTVIRIEVDGVKSNWSFDERELDYKTPHWPDVAKIRAADAILDLLTEIRRRKGGKSSGGDGLVLIEPLDSIVESPSPKDERPVLGYAFDFKKSDEVRRIFGEEV